jgi:mannosyl-3-phosphoglycerate phosphatase
MRYLIFTDLDGTLLDHNNYAHDAAIPVLELLHQHSVDVIPNTSKTKQELELIRDDLGLTTPFITENGSAVYIPKNIIPKQPAETEDIGHYWRKSFCKPREHWIELLSNHAKHFQPCYTGFSQMTAQQLSQHTGLTLKQAELANTREFSEPLLWHGTTNEHSEFSALMRKAGANILKGGRFTHVSGNSNKGLAMVWLTALYNHTKSLTHQTIALGDSYNDNDMLEIADIAIQIKSPVHDFPKLSSDNQILQSTLYGPSGWSECITQIFNPTKERQHG